MPESGELIESRSLQAKSGDGLDNGSKTASTKIAREVWGQAQKRGEHHRLLGEAVSLDGSASGSLALNMSTDGTFSRAKEKPTVAGEKSPEHERKSIETKEAKESRPAVLEERGSKSGLSELKDLKDPARPETKGTHIAAQRFVAHQTRVQELGRSNWGTASHGILDGNLNRGIGAALVLSVGLSYYIQYRQSHEAPPLYEKPCKITGK